MLSRVAHTIYWMNRYIERAENYARFMEVNFNLSLELHPNATEERWQPLVVTTGDWPLYDSLYDHVEKSKVINFLGFNRENPNSIYNCVRAARENARAIRPEITMEVWEQINHLYYMVQEEAENKIWELEDPRNFFLEVKKSCQLVYGIVEATISKSEGWHFGKIGQLIERADKTSRVLDVKYHMLLPKSGPVGSPFDLTQWSSLLKSVSAFDMYRKKNGKLTPHDISDFLIFDKAFPRSILSCLIGVEKSLYSISGRGEGFSNTAEKELGRLKSQLEYADINDVFDKGLHEYLDDLQKKLNTVSDKIFETFFTTDKVPNEKKTFSY